MLTYIAVFAIGIVLGIALGILFCFWLANRALQPDLTTPYFD